MIDLIQLELQKFGISVISQDNESIVVRGLNNQKFWRLNRFLPERLTSEMIGFWFGDGDKVNSLGITNTQIQLVGQFLDFTDTLGIPRDKFKTEITVKSEDQVNKQEIAEILGVLVRKIKIKTSELARNPSFRVRMFSRIITRLFHCLLEFISNSSIPLKIDFIRGIIAAEGCVGLRPDGKIHNVSISLKSPKEKMWLKEKFIHPIGITTEKDNEDSIVIGNKRNFNLLLQNNLLSLHLEKQEKFVNSFSF